MQILALLCVSFHPTFNEQSLKKKFETSFRYLKYRFDRHCHKRDHKNVFLMLQRDKMLDFEC